MKKFLLALALLSLTGFADESDPNFIQAHQLPKSVFRHARIETYFTPLPPITPELVEKLKKRALEDQNVERICMSKTGAQISEWEKIVDDKTAFKTFTVQARFECLPPVTTIATDYSDANRKKIYDLIGLTPVTDTHFVSVLCYEQYDEVCENGKLMRYNEREVCEADGTYGKKP